MTGHAERPAQAWRRYVLPLVLVLVLVLGGIATAGCLTDFSIAGNHNTTTVCGDGVLQPGEVCDDGNTVGGDDCSADCRVDLSNCGNGQIDPGESCDDGNFAPGDGCSAACQVEECSPSRCPFGCCDLSGVCLPGTQDQSCGSGGLNCQDCTISADQACQDQQCEELGPCTVNEIQDCGNCGTRTCLADESWGDCEAQGTCSPDQIEPGVTCGMCGHEERICDDGCAWGDWACVGETGVCSPGTREDGTNCGTCAVETRTCLSNCTWSDWICGSGGVCSPTETEIGDDCGDCGTNERTCTNQCTWGSWTCEDEGVCSPGTTDSGASCGDCGTNERTCTNQCTWGTWACEDEGVCDSGTLEKGTGCGACGTNERTCTSICTWGAWSCNDPANCVEGLCEVSCLEMDVCDSLIFSVCMGYCQDDLNDCSAIELMDYAACNAVLPGVACDTYASWNNCIVAIACIGDG
jgi:cysteine-rich repeat protein